MFFDLLSMFDYEDRAVARFEESDVFVSTAAVSDSTHPYETAIGHPEYNDGKLIIVELYGDRDSAAAGHERWVATMTAESLPEVLRDAAATGEGSHLGSLTAALGAAAGMDMTEEFTYPRVKPEPCD